MLRFLGRLDENAILESGEMYELAVEGHDGRSLAVAQPHRRAGDGVEDWLHVRRRARYHTQDLAARPLLLERLG